MSLQDDLDKLIEARLDAEGMYKEMYDFMDNLYLLRICMEKTKCELSDANKEGKLSLYKSMEMFSMMLEGISDRHKTYKKEIAGYNKDLKEILDQA